MPISVNLLENYDMYSRKYLQVIKNIFDCNNCINKCIDNSICNNYKEHVVDNLCECPCFLDNQPNAREISANKDDDNNDETPIYERLSVGEALIISRDEDDNILVAENHDGKVEFRYVTLPSEKISDK